MALAALIPAYAEVTGGDALRAALPIAGHALIEHQARQAVQAGATTIVLVVERVPAPLTAAIDRLRRSGLSIEVARSVNDAADRVHPDEHVLVIADGLIADQVLVDQMAGATVPSLLAVPDDSDHGAFERIDANTRWGGLMLIDGARLRQTALMLGDWDLQSTLLRRTVQDAPKRIPATGGLAIVAAPAEIDRVRVALLSATRGRARGWPARFVYAPLEDLTMPPLVRAGVDPLSIRGIGIAVLLVSALAFYAGWALVGVVLLIVASPIDAVARRMARVQLQALHRNDAAGVARAGAMLLVLCAYAAALARHVGWGVWPLALVAAGAMTALHRELALMRARPAAAPREPLALADEDALVLVLIPFAVTGHWLVGLAVVALYAAASFFAVQHLLLTEARQHAV